jgi:MYXO-CTERM domain-containing protein
MTGKVRLFCRSLPLAVAFGVPWSAGARAANIPTLTASHYIDLCPLEADGHRRCDVKIVADDKGKPIQYSSPVGGYGPADLQSAYGLSAAGGAGKLVVLFGGNSDYPQAEADLGVYRSQFGLPPCTTANGCFAKVDENGGTNYPAAGGSEVEQALDMEMASAACPACKIMLIEGGDMDVALATVIAKGASAFSFSVLFGYGASTGSQCENMGFNKNSGLVITGALGDTKYPGARDFLPVACQGVLAVGGTTLNKASNARGWTETAWSGTGSGCSPYVNKPSWQTDTGCSMRMEGDVAAVSDPGTGMAIYTTLGANGWLIVGGTSAAAPLTAGSLTNLGIANGQFSPAWIWQNPVNFYDITSGSNGPCNAGDPGYYCNAGAGYDGPTGWGTINGALLSTALPPGSPVGPTCNLPTGSYSASCTLCVAENRTTGCTLVCQECAKTDGTQNPGPTLGLPCGGSVDNNDGLLVCSGAADAGSSADAGDAVDAGADPDASTATDAGHGADGGAVADAGGADATTGYDAGTSGEGGGMTPIDAAVSSDGAPTSGNGVVPFDTSGGCACTSAPGQRSSAPMALSAGLALVWLRRWRRRRPQSKCFRFGQAAPSGTRGCRQT